MTVAALRTQKDRVYARFEEIETSLRNVQIGDVVATRAWQTAAPLLRDADIELEILVFDRVGKLMGREPFARHASRPLNRR